MGYKYKDLLKEIQQNAQKETEKSDFEEYVKKFQEAARDINWPNPIIREYLYDNRTASVSQAGQIYKDEIPFLQKPEDWKSIAETLNKIVDTKNGLDTELYNKLEEDVVKKIKKIDAIKKDKRHPISAINRMIFTLRPDLLSCIASKKQLDIVCNFIEKCDDYDGDQFPEDYFEKSNKLLELIKKETNEDCYKIASYAWRLKEKIVDLEQYVDLLLKNKNIILTGAPGTGKTHLAKRIAKHLTSKECIGFVQFHPSYDYTDFVEGLRPIKKGDTIGFERKDGIFMDFCRKALADQDNKYVFIIDEINRGEMSKILGELFFSIDPGYRGKEGEVSTQYSNLWKDSDNQKFGDSEKFHIPENVYIIGTMNDIDRSVESMDFAMRRRFAFKEINPEDRMDMIQETFGLEKDYPEIVERMTKLNDAIKSMLGSSYQIGASYFLKLLTYKTKGGITTTSWEQLWENHLKGVLYEYFRGLPEDELQEKMKTLETAYKIDSKKKQTQSTPEKNSQ